MTASDGERNEKKRKNEENKETNFHKFNVYFIIVLSQICGFQFENDGCPDDLNLNGIDAQ